jgi:hypothetical protein
MMAKFGKTSKKRLAECDEKLQIIANEVIKIMDVTILCGHRGKDEQDKAYTAGNSQLKFPNSKHNSLPSKAVDVCPYPISWDDLPSFERMCGIIEGIAHEKGIKIRLGRDFSFKDYVHIELV